jgi:hypothetical protein
MWPETHGAPIGTCPSARSGSDGDGGGADRRAGAEGMVFRDAACRDKPDGRHCGTGTNRQLLYECAGGQIVRQTPCPGGCDPATLACKAEFGVKGIDPPKAR